MHTLLELLVSLIFDVVVELFFHVPGTVFRKIFFGGSTEQTHGCLSAIAGMIFWGVIVFGIWWLLS